MTKIPSRCPTCRLELPSISALKSHKAQAHPTPSKPPGPSLKAKDVTTKKKTTPGKGMVNKNNLVNFGASTSAGGGGDQATAADSAASPKLNSSADLMSRWMTGSASSNKKKGGKGKSSQGKNDEAGPMAPPTLDESINLLRSMNSGRSEVSISISNTPVVAMPRGPTVSTLKVFPPEMEAVPILDEGGWILRQRMTQAEDNKDTDGQRRPPQDKE